VYQLSSWASLLNCVGELLRRACLPPMVDFVKNQKWRYILDGLIITHLF